MTCAATPGAWPALYTSTTLAEGASARAHRALVERLVDNLVGNAVRHTPTGGEITVTLRADPATLVIANSGPLFTREQVEAFLVPFRRGTVERTGSSNGQGLGLAIAQSIAAAHHASFVVTPREGGGLQVEVAFPAT